MSTAPTKPTTDVYNPLGHWSIDDLRRTISLNEQQRREAMLSADDLARKITEMARELLRRAL